MLHKIPTRVTPTCFICNVHVEYKVPIKRQKSLGECFNVDDLLVVFNLPVIACGYVCSPLMSSCSPLVAAGAGPVSGSSQQLFSSLGIQAKPTDLHTDSNWGCFLPSWMGDSGDSRLCSSAAWKLPEEALQHIELKAATGRLKKEKSSYSSPVVFQSLLSWCFVCIHFLRCLSFSKSFKKQIY